MTDDEDREELEEEVSPNPATTMDDPSSEPLLPETDATWQGVVRRVSDGVVVIKTTGVRAFYTESAGSAYATGFVVDKARGVVLTNRHVCRPGPVTAEAVFQNREEVPLRALYRFVRPLSSTARYATSTHTIHALHATSSHAVQLTTLRRPPSAAIPCTTSRSCVSTPLS